MSLTLVCFTIFIRSYRLISSEELNDESFSPSPLRCSFWVFYMNLSTLLRTQINLIWVLTIELKLRFTQNIAKKNGWDGEGKNRIKIFHSHLNSALFPLTHPRRHLSTQFLSVHFTFSPILLTYLLPSLSTFLST